MVDVLLNFIKKSYSKNACLKIYCSTCEEDVLQDNDELLNLAVNKVKEFNEKMKLNNIWEVVAGVIINDKEIDLEKGEIIHLIRKFRTPKEFS